MFTAEDLARLPYRRGPISARVAMIGEAPGESEEHDEFKRPFIGASGQLLEEMMQKSGIDPSAVYFTNTIKERPEEKEIGKWIKKNSEKYNLYVNILSEELRALPNLQMIVPVGATALHAICGKNSIDSWRGSIIPATLKGIAGKKCVGIIHPAAILREWLFKPATTLDLQRIAEESKFPEIIPAVRSYKLRPTFEEIMDTIYTLKRSTGLLSVDLETLPRPQRIVSIQLCDNPQSAMPILLQHKDGRDCWPEDQELLIWKALIDLLQNCGQRIIGQNILTFDLFMLQVFGFDVQKLLKNVYLDTMEAFKCLQPQLPCGLDFLTSIYTKEPYYKSEGKEWGTKQGEDEFLMYGCKDVMVVSEIAPQLYKELEEDKLLDFYYERFQGLARARLKMTRRGLLIDEKKRIQLEKQFTKDIVIAQCKLNVLTGENINVKSSPQMQSLLYDKMHLPKQWSKLGTVTCDENAILALSAKYPSEAFKHIIYLRGKRTLFSSDIKAKKDSDGRIRCSFGFAETGRFRSFACPLGSGGNLQNKTQDMKVMFVPDPGKVLLEGDLSQAEARVVAWAGHIPYMIDAFTNNKDIHSETAVVVLGFEREKVTKKSPERFAAKTVVHSADYDVHGPTFAKSYNKKAAEMGYALISSKIATELLARYHANVPELKGNYHKWIEDQLKTTKTLYNPFGRRMVFHDRIGGDLFRAGYAWYAQSTVADVTNIILASICEEFDVLLQVHDSILLQCLPEEVPYVINKMKLANPTFTVGGMDLRIPMEVKTSSISWYDLKDYEEENKDKGKAA
jgi:uracil-DNA glycosylase family 4